MACQPYNDFQNVRFISTLPATSQGLFSQFSHVALEFLSPLLMNPGDRMSVARKIPDAEWNKHKDLFCNLYKDHSLNEVLITAAKNYEFHARYNHINVICFDLME